MSGRVAFLFPGQLSEWIGMGKDFLDSDSEARELCALTSRRCGRDLRRLMLEGPEEALRENLATAASLERGDRHRLAVGNNAQPGRGGA